MSNLVERCGDLPRTSVPAGKVLIEQGQAPGPVYVLVDGEVAIERNGQGLARVNVEGAMFGEMSTLLHCPATATVRTTMESTFIVADDGEAFLISRPEVTLSVARALAGRLDNVSGYLVEVKRQFGGEKGHLGMLDEILSDLLNKQPPAVKPGSARMPDYDY